MANFGRAYICPREPVTYGPGRNLGDNLGDSPCRETTVLRSIGESTDTQGLRLMAPSRQAHMPAEKTPGTRFDFLRRGTPSKGRLE